MNAPVLYTFRRCPYAMRARMALAASGIEVRVREIVLRRKPAEMLAASPKGTVPVLVLPDGRVLDESLDVMLWALGQSDPEGWLRPDAGEMRALIAQNDGAFKRALDRYKYPERFAAEGVSAGEHRSAGMDTLRGLSARIEAHAGQLFGAATSLADIAIFPFVRQFAATDAGYWEAEAPPALRAWLSHHVASTRFAAIMAKHPPWQTGEREPLLSAG
jgi:glutathione S-transferase